MESTEKHWGVSEIEFRVIVSDRTIKHVHAISYRVTDDSGDTAEVMGTIVDITERRRAETERERLRQLEANLARISRVSMMGEFAASVAHEIKQPMSAALTNARTCMRWLRRETPDVAEACEAASRLLNDTARAAEIIDRVRSLYKQGVSKRELLDVNEIIREMTVLLQDKVNRTSISVRSELDPALPHVTGDRVQLQQVLVNLMLNGIEAMKDATGELAITSKATADDQVLVSVSDSGVGIAPEQSNDIFEAFFTTKPQGTGMGLSISRRIIESHGGRIWAITNSGRGSTFQFTLPTHVRASSAA
jgi:signal transduction histidine kinase